MTFRRPRLLALVAASALLLSACGDEAGTRENLVDALSDPAGQQPGVSEAEAECIADRLYTQFDEDTLDQLAAARAPEQLPPGTATALRDATAECVAATAG
jgi:hypothetical protein